MSKDKFPLMGKIVTVSEIYERQYLHDQDHPKKERRIWGRTTIKPRAGWVTGYRTLYEGNYHSPSYSSAYGDEGPDYEPAFLEVNNTIKCLLISFFPTYNPVRVPVDSVVEGGKPTHTFTPWTEADKAVVREEVRDQPRDDKGRWKPFESPYITKAPAQIVRMKWRG